MAVAASGVVREAAAWVTETKAADSEVALVTAVAMAAATVADMAVREGNGSLTRGLGVGGQVRG